MDVPDDLNPFPQPTIFIKELQPTPKPFQKKQPPNPYFPTLGRKNLTMPQDRYYHAQCESGDGWGNDLYLFGGIDKYGNLHSDFWKFQKPKENFEMMPIRNRESMAPSKRYGCGICLREKVFGPKQRLQNQKKLVLVGGCIAEGEYSSQVYEYCLLRHRWRKIPVAGSKPCLTLGHSVVYDEFLDSVLLYGSWRSSNIFSLSFDLPKNDISWTSITGTWKRVLSCVDETSEEYDLEPVARNNQSLVYLKSKRQLVLFGGQEYENMKLRNDVWIFSIAGRRWRKINSYGDVPCPRHSHGAALMNDSSQLIIYGGFTKSENGQVSQSHLFDNEMYSLNLNSKMWQRVRLLDYISRNPVSIHCRLGLRMTTIADEQIMMFGGYHCKRAWKGGRMGKYVLIHGTNFCFRENMWKDKRFLDVSMKFLIEE